MKCVRAAVIVVLSLAASACGGGFVAGRAWDAEAEATIFDDGVDLVDDPAKLSGEFEDGARRALEIRAATADLTALVEVTSIQTTKDVDGTEARRIGAELTEILYGKAPDPSIAFESAATALGNQLITRHERRLAGPFVIFVRWFDRPDGSLGSHFHLSPSSPAVMELVRGRIGDRIKREAASK
jgi:hypothetical protein